MPQAIEEEEGGETAAGGAAAAAFAPGEESEIERLRREATENYDRFLRERAEAENFKKRILREKAEALRFATEPLIRDLLPVVDNLERALAHCPEADRAVRAGLELVLKSFLETLERHHVKRVESVGRLFDPSLHEAIAQVESTDHAANTVIEQHQVGYLLHDRLIRPALVTVSTARAADTVEKRQNSG